MMWPDTWLSRLLLLAVAAPLVRVIVGRWFPTMPLHQRHFLNQVSFLCMGLGLGALISLHAWVATLPNELILAVIVAVSAVSALSLLGRSPIQVWGWTPPFTLGLAVCVGFFVTENEPVPALLIGVALLADLTWAILGRFLWELEHRPFHGPAINLNVAGDGVAEGGGVTMGPGAGGVAAASPMAASGMASTAVAKALTPKVPSDTFAQLIGMDQTKQALLRALQRALDDPETSNGILLFGPPGNGKTRLVRAVCGELKTPMVEMAIADMVSPHHGQGPRALSDAFDQACRAPGHTVLFLDEIDAVLTDRGSQAAMTGDAALLTQVFLTKVSEARERGLIVVGATNFMDRLDPAAIREGRFDHRLEIPHPGATTRRLILERQLPTLSAQEREVAVQRLSGYSIARLMTLTERVKERHPHEALTWAHLMTVLRELQGTAGQYTWATLRGLTSPSTLTRPGLCKFGIKDLRSRFKIAL